MKDILLITPPFTQLNTPYPATAYLKGFLNTKNINSFQMDLGIEVILELFSKKSLEYLFEYAFENNKIISENCSRIYTLKNNYISKTEPVIKFLQGTDQTLARLICSDSFLPRASRFDQLDDMDWNFGLMGFQDKAKHLATLFIEDLSDFIKECIDKKFGFSRYAERLGNSANDFNELHNFLKKTPTYIDNLALSILRAKIEIIQPKIICLSVPFPGNLYSAFRCAQMIKKEFPKLAIIMGGGFPNTELRSISDSRVFDYIDFITLDDGELPIELLVTELLDKKNTNIISSNLKRTFLLDNNTVVYNNNSLRQDYKLSETGTPDYSDLLVDKYISVIEVTNPMHSLWSDGRWNKLTMGHGCYWGKCTFCDGSLDYIKTFSPVSAILLVDRMEEIINQTGNSGFHFVDEAAPPALMRALAIEIIKRKLTVTWWTNIRFEKKFTKDLAVLLNMSGCIAVSGGLEVASDRLLKLINKGVTVKQVAEVTKNLTDSGIMVHSYLMYGFPSQTVQETIDSLELVRQMFELGIIQSGFWHQFALTAHSPIGLNPQEFGITPEYKTITFANNDVQFKDKAGIDHTKFSYGLRKALFNFMRGIGFDVQLKEWFDFKIPKPTINKFYIEDCIVNSEYIQIKPTNKLIWIGSNPEISHFSKSKKGKNIKFTKMLFQNNQDNISITTNSEEAEWIVSILSKLSIDNEKILTYSDLKKDYELRFDNFEVFWFSNTITELKKCGLLVL